MKIDEAVATKMPQSMAAVNERMTGAAEEEEREERQEQALATS